MLTTITSKYEFTKILIYFFPWNFSINLHDTGNSVKLFHIKATKLFGHTVYLRSVVRHTAGETLQLFSIRDCYNKTKFAVLNPFQISYLLHEQTAPNKTGKLQSQCTVAVFWGKTQQEGTR